jgi:hypothetical protein
MASERWKQSVKNQVYRQRKKDGLPRLLSEGDSWFGYPIYRNIIDYIDDNERYAIRRCEQSGDMLAEILNTGEFYPLIDKEEPRCLLFDGGGNDLIDGNNGWPDNLFQPPVGPDLINVAAWQAKLQELMDMYENRLVPMLAGRVPILVHGYDALIPSDVAVTYDWLPVTGPWFKPALDAAGIATAGDQRKIGKKLIDDFNDGLAGVAARVNAGLPRPVFYHADLRGTLAPGDWANEMHPYSRGFKALARVYLDVLENQVLPQWP